MDAELRRALNQAAGERDDGALERLTELIEALEAAARTLQLQHGRPGDEELGPHNPARSPATRYGQIAVGGNASFEAEDLLRREYATAGFVENRGPDELLLTVDGFDEGVWQLPLPAGRVLDLTGLPWRMLTLENQAAQASEYSLLAR
jgi:hypothetical protein